VKIKGKHNVLLILLIFGSLAPLFAQYSNLNNGAAPKWFVGLNGGTTLFLGDVKYNSFWPERQQGELQASGSFAFGRKFNSSFRLSTELSYISLKGFQEILPDTLEFKTQALSIALQGHYNVLHLFTKSDAKTALYLEGGAGIMAWKNLLENTYTNDTLGDFGWTNTDKQTSLFLPVGIKLEYQISPRLSTYFKSNYNFVFSDLLDGNALGKDDHFIYNTLGINYYIGKQKTIPKLLPYTFSEINYDSIAQKTKAKSEKQKKEEKPSEITNPFYTKFEVPQTAPHTGLDIHLKIAKLGVKASGFFRLILPSGFIPQASSNPNVSFSKLDYRYEYEFILPMNEDSTTIPIHIDLSEIEMGTYPIFVEGEIMNQPGTIFPLKFAAYVKIISEEAWNQGLLAKNRSEILKNKTQNTGDENQIAVSTPISDKTKSSETEQAEPTKKHIADNSSSAVYRIQIMASRKPFTDIENFKATHNINTDFYIAQADGWYRYNLYTASTREEAENLKEKVRKEHEIPQAFIAYYENGERVINKSASSSTSNATSLSNNAHIQNQVAAKQKTTTQNYEIESQFTDQPVYRIEFALGYNKPIPLYVLQNKVGKEEISEFKINNDYYYTIGEFEELKVAKAYLNFVRNQFKLEAKIAQYQNKTRIKVVY